MIKLRMVVCWVVLAVALTGCSNAITYYHTERASIALEAKTTDPQQPLQGNVGIKSRTVVVAPGKKAPDEGARQGAGTYNELGEAASVISDFKLERKESGVFGTTHINSAFITGDAAKAAPVESATAISGLGFGPISDTSVYDFEFLSLMYDQLKNLGTNGDDAEAARHVKLLDTLGDLLPKDLSGKTYYIIDAASNIKEIEGKTVTIKRNFKGALRYEDYLRDSLVAIQKMKTDRSITFMNSVINDTNMKKFETAEKQLEKDRENFFATIGNSNIIDSAAAYTVSRL